jgi:hypothetical protein
MAEVTCPSCKNSFQDGAALARHRKNNPGCQDTRFFKSRLAVGASGAKKKSRGGKKMASLEANDELVAHAEEDYLHVLTEQIGSLVLEIRRAKAKAKVLEMTKKYRSRIARRLGMKEADLGKMDKEWQKAHALKFKTE